MTDSDGVTFVQGDTGPDMTVTLHPEDSTDPLDLTTAEAVYFQMRKPDDRRFTVNAAATIDSPPTAGKVRYRWATNDLAMPGQYDIQWKIVYNDGQVIHTEQPARITVRRE